MSILQTSALDVPARGATASAVPLRLSAAGLGIVGALISLLGSWTPSLWGDEAASLMSAERSIPSLFRMLGHVDAVHGTYYLGLHFWIGVFGTSPLALRMPSALAIGVCVAGVVVLGARLDSWRLGLIAGIVCAILPRVTYMGEEARSYAFSAAIATWLTVIFVAAVRARIPRRRLWIAYAALLALGVYVFLYIALIAVAHLAVILADPARRRLWRRWAAASATAAIAASPVVIVAILEHGQIEYLGSHVEVTFETIAVTLWFGGVAFAVLAWALIIVALWRPRWPAIVVGAWLLVPSILLICSHFLIPDFTARYLSMCAPAAALLIGIGILRLTRGRTVWIAIALAVAVAIAAPIWMAQRGPFAKNDSDWAQISAHLGARAHPGDAVVFDEAVRPSRMPRLALRTYPQGFAGLRDVSLASPFYDNVGWHDSQYSVKATANLGRFDGIRRVWAVEYATPGHVDTTGLATLRRLGFHEVGSTPGYRNVIFEFVR